MISACDGHHIRTYVKDINLWDFVWDVQPHDILVSYNGERFDLPFIRKAFNIRLNCFHVDLFPVLNALGYRGGLKHCLDVMGVERRFHDVNGETAVLLWEAYEKNHDPEALEKLKGYNAEDAWSLTAAMATAYNRVMEACPLRNVMKIPGFKSPSPASS